ncbi:MAG: hypothetical protein ACRDCE_14105 [Cetobacterium sp.]|uniref:hypothetical protein n=1 Tax=Cetobacterium sp. TaxID=2071632 RepID=UPI003EE7A8D5
MNKKNLKIFFLKYFFPSVILYVLFLIDTYMSNNVFVPFGTHDIIIFLFLLFLVTMFWAFLYYFQETVGEVMEKGTVGIVVFVIVALIVIYLYKSTGKI